MSKVTETPQPVKTEQPVSDGAVKLANKLKTLILHNNPGAKVPDDIKKWAIDIDRMLRIDKRAETEIESVIIFSQQDPFWMSNILSAATLREKYDKLYLRMKNQGGKNAIDKSGIGQFPVRYKPPEEVIAQRNRERNEQLRQ